MQYVSEAVHGSVAGGKRPKSALKPSRNVPHAQPDTGREPKRERDRDMKRDWGEGRDRGRRREEDDGRDGDDTYGAGSDSPMLPGMIHFPGCFCCG